MNPLREIFALFTVKFDDKDLKKGQKRVEAFRKRLVQFGGALAGVFGARALARGFVQTGENLDRIAKLARGVGTTVERLQDMEFALDRLGGDPGSVRNMVVALNKALGDAQTGSKEYVDSFKDIGVNFQELAGLDPVDQFQRIRDAMMEAEGSARSIAGASIVLGRGFKGNLPVFKATSEEWQDLIRQRRELGGFTQDQANLGEKLQDVRRDFKQVNDALKGQAFAAVAPDVIQFIKWLTETIKLERELGTLNASLSQSFTLLGAAITAALGPVGFLFFSLANLFRVVKANWEDLGRSFTFVFEQIAAEARKLEDIPILGAALRFLRRQNEAGVAAQEAETGTGGARAPTPGLDFTPAPGQTLSGIPAPVAAAQLPPGSFGVLPSGEITILQTVEVDATGMSSNQVQSLIDESARKAARGTRSRSE